MLLPVELASRLDQSIIGLHEAVSVKSVLSLVGLLGLLFAMWQWSPRRRHQLKAQAAAQQVLSESSPENIQIASVVTASEELPEEAQGEQPRIVDRSLASAKKKSRRGGKGRKTPPSSVSSTASTAVPDAPVSDPVSDDAEHDAEGWSAASAKKTRKQMTKGKHVEEQPQQLAFASLEGDQPTAKLSSRDPQHYEDDLSDDCGDFSDLYYSKKGQRHNFTRKDKQRHNYRDATRVAYVVETRMKQSATDRGLIPRAQ